MKAAAERKFQGPDKCSPEDIYVELLARTVATNGHNIGAAGITDSEVVETALLTVLTTSKRRH